MTVLIAGPAHGIIVEPDDVGKCVHAIANVPITVAHDECRMVRIIRFYRGDGRFDDGQRRIRGVLRLVYDATEKPPKARTIAGDGGAPRPRPPAAAIARLDTVHQ